jgi:hypothetical protein
MISIVVLGLLIVGQEISSAPKQSLSECKAIHYSGEERIDLVYIGNTEEAKEYSDFFLETEPFNEYQDYFNVLNINEEPKNCDRYKGIALLCDRSDTINQAATCPSADIIIALKEDEPRIRSAAQGKVISLNTKINQKSVQTHELGHAIKNFDEEYLSLGSARRNSENCKKSPEDFTLPTDKISLECTKKDLYRPSESSVMRTLNSNNFDTHNTILMKQEIEEKVPQMNNPITGKAIDLSESCVDKKHIIYVLNSKTGESKSEVHKGCESTNPFGVNNYKILKDGIEILEGFYSSHIFTDGVEESGELSGETFESDDIVLSLKYPPVGDKIQVFIDDVLISESRLDDVGKRPCAR